MKNIHLILHNIRRIIIHNKITSLVVIFSIVFTTFGLLFYSGYIYNVSSERKISYGDTITIKLDDNIQYQDITEIIDDLEKDVKIQSLLVSSQEPIQEDGNYNIVGEYNASYENILLSGNYFSRSEENGLLVLPEYLVGDIAGYNEYPIGKILNIKGHQLKISGVLSFLYTDYLIVPIEYYIKNFDTHFISCTFKDKNINLEKIEKIQNNSFVKEVNLTKPVNVLYTSQFWVEFGQIILIFAAAIINLFTIIYFWIVREKRMYNIYSICGSTTSSIIKIIAGQSFAIILFGIILGIVLFSILSSFFVKYNLIKIDYLLYIIIIAIIILITYFYSIFVAIKSNIHNQIYIIKE